MRTHLLVIAIGDEYVQVLVNILDTILLKLDSEFRLVESVIIRFFFDILL